MKLSSRDLQAGYAGRQVLHGLNLEVTSGEIVALIGPNGSGKSTLLHALGRVLRPQGGSVFLDGRVISEWPTRELAQQLALLPQAPALSEDHSVEELVWLGRSPHQGLFGLPTGADREAVRWAIQETGIEDLARRPMSSLSDGERQRAWLAMALAQQPRVLLLDEPTTFLDLSHQIEVLDLIRYLNREHGLTIVMVLHDLNQAIRYADRLVALKDGAIYADGVPADVLSSETLRVVFGVTAEILRGPRGVEMVVVPIGRSAPS
jgi:iron complex transport system ATP-binding protein